MATLTRLASTLTAKYFPSQSLTDAFYIDGRLFGKREVRGADITIDKEERGFFFSVFSHPTIAGYEPGMMPPYEPQLRSTCNEVKFGRKEIDGMIEGFLSTAVDVTGKMKLRENENRNPYFAGVIVHDAEAFAVTIGTGLAFLYRDDTLFPLTDAGIAMEPIDSFGNRVSDFNYYCSSKTVNALWSNFFTLSVDDCVVLCNKEVYDALGQRELLRILEEADDQCDAAGTVITQASARMPNVPMQFSISFVESITSDEKHGLFGFKKKNKGDKDESTMSIKSTFDGGVVGAAAEAVAGAGFVQGVNQATTATGTAATAGVVGAAAATGAGVLFGDNAGNPGPFVPPVNQSASGDKGIEVPNVVEEPQTQGSIEFLDTSVDKNEVAPEISAEDMMKTLFGEMQETASTGAEIQKEAQTAAADAIVSADLERIIESEATTVTAPDVTQDQTPFTATFNPFDTVEGMQTVSSTPVDTTAESDMDKTKPVEGIQSLFANSVLDENSIKQDGIIAAALKERSEEAEAAQALDTSMFVAPASAVPENESGEMVFAPSTDEAPNPFVAPVVDAADPYNVGEAVDMENAAPLIYGDTQTAEPIQAVVPETDVIPEVEAPKYEFEATEYKAPSETEKLGVDFPETTKVEPESAPVETNEGDFVLPFANGANTVGEEAPVVKAEEDIPQMPTYDANTYESPVYATSSDEAVNPYDNQAYTVGQYAENEEAAPAYDNQQNYQQNYQQEASAPYNSYGAENFNYNASAEGYDPNYAQQGYVDPNAYAQQGYVDPNAYAQQGYADPNAYAQQGYADPNAYAQQGYADPNVYAQQGYEQQGYVDPNSFMGEQPVQDGFGAQNAGSNEDDWINNLLGLDNSAESAYATGQSFTDAGMAGAAGAAGVAGAAGAGAYSQGGYAGMNGNNNPGGNYTSNYRAANTQRSHSNGNGTNRPGSNSSNGGSGNNGGKKFFGLTRNGAIFLACVGVFLICLIVVICIAVKSCTADKDDKRDTESTTTTEATMQTIETTPATVDPTAPIGRFVFSDNIGYMTFRDLLNNVYNIQIEDASDPRITIILTYNGLDATYMPVSGDILLLPPVEMINGTMAVVTYGAATTPVESGVSGEPIIGETTTVAGETTVTETSVA